MRDLVGDAEAVLHLATAIPTKPKTSPRDWVTNDRLRREGTRNLVEACRGRQVRAFIQQSVAYVYGDVRGEWLDEDVLTISARYCNDKIKSRLGWSPQFPTYGEGFAEVLSKIMV